VQSITSEKTILFSETDWRTQRKKLERHHGYLTMEEKLFKRYKEEM
jgi:hypothetical protein